MVNRTQALAHNDTLDREVTKDFLEQNKWYGIELGDTYDLDLEVHEFNRGCDVEMINYGMDRFKQHNHFRIPVRKQKYWSNAATYLDKNGIKQKSKIIQQGTRGFVIEWLKTRSY